jgi:phenylalanyl-tRNA synthetase alpha chain
MFHQIEGLVIDETTHLGHLKWCLEEFCKAFFEVDEVRMRFRASHFPFTEPSMEVDIDAAAIGKPGQWLEILGSGMVHPNVIRNCNLDPHKCQGFAFGMGLDRIAMLKYGIPDLRDMFSADLRWLRHYGFAALDIPSLAGGLSP